MYNKTTNTIQYILNNTDDDKSLSQNSVIASYKDDEGIIWLGTYKEGINYYHENIIKFAVYRHHPSDPKSLNFDDVNRFVDARHQSLLSDILPGQQRPNFPQR